MTLHSKISNDLSKVLNFLIKNIITDGEENGPQSLIISFRHVDFCSRISSYIYLLPHQYTQKNMQWFFNSIMKEMKYFKPDTPAAENIHVDYKLTFENGSTKVISLLEEIDKVAKQRAKLKKILIEEVVQLVREIEGLFLSFDPSRVYYWQIALETPRIEKQVQRYFFNYRLNDILSLRLASQTSDPFPDLYNSVLMQLENFLELLETRDETGFELKFKTIILEENQHLLRDSGIDLAQRCIQRLKITDRESEPTAAASIIALQDEVVTRTDTIATAMPDNEQKEGTLMRSKLGSRGSFFEEQARLPLSKEPQEKVLILFS